MKARLVAWGGRPDIDIQIGSPQDRRRIARLNRVAQHKRASRALTASMQGFAVGMQRMDQTLDEAFRPFADMASRMEGVDPDTLRERWKRNASRRAIR